MKSNFKKQSKFPKLISMLGVFVFTIILNFSFLVNNSFSAPDNELTYHGKLTDNNDIAVPDTSYDFKLTIYDAATGGNCLWTSRGTCGTPTAKSVPVTNGIFNITLGEVGDNSLDSITFDSNYYLGVTIDSNSEMTPRRKITPTGFALNSQRLGGFAADSYIDTTSNQTKTGTLDINNDFTVNTNNFHVDTTNNRVGIGTTSPSQALHISGNMRLTGAYYDANNLPGTNGQVLTSTVTGTDWVDASTIGATTLTGLNDTPAGYGTAGQVLVTDGSGDLSWADTSGGISPSFSVYKNANQSISSGSWTKLTWNSENFDTNNNFDLTNDRFTATVPGKYAVNASALIDTNAAGEYGVISIYKNGVAYKNAYDQSGSSADQSLRISIVLDLAASDYIEVYVYQNTGGSRSILGASPTHSHFTGSRIDGGNGLWTLNAPDISYTAGNVGIGTTSPDYELQVDGDIVPETTNISTLGTTDLRWQDVYVGPASLHVGVTGDEGIISYDTINDAFNFDKAVIFGNATTPATGMIRWSGTDFEGYNGTGWGSLTKSDAWTQSGSDIYRSGGNVGIGTVTPNATLDVKGNTALNVPSDFWASSADNYYGFHTPYGYLGSNGAYAVSLFSNGYRNSSGGFTSLGIDGNTTASGIELRPTGDIQFRTGTPSGTTVPERMTIDSDGNVGIGTITPGKKIDIVHDTDTWDGITIGETGVPGESFTIQHYGGVSSGTQLVQAGNLPIRFFTNGNEGMRVNGNGDVGIGITSPGYKLHVNGNAYATTLNTGEGNNELYAMDQNVLTTSDVQFNGLTITTNNQATETDIKLSANSNISTGSSMHFFIDDDNTSTVDNFYWKTNAAFGAGTTLMSLNELGDLTLSGDLNLGANTLTTTNTGLVSNLNADLLDGYNSSEASTINTVAVRNNAGDINARLFRSEFDSTNATVGYIMTQIDTATNNFIRPSTPAQLVTGLGLEAGGSRDIWVEKAGDTMTGNLNLGANTLTTTNTGLVSNLNADLLDGHNTDYFQTALTNPVTGTGTANYLSKWTGTTTQADSLVYDNGTNVGIGDTTPAQKLEVGGYVQAGRYIDRDNTGFYLDPASTSYLNDIRPSIMYDRDNTSYYVNPNSTSVMNLLYTSDMRSSIYYDRDNTGYYVNPNSTSRIENMEIDGNDSISALRIDDSTVWAGVSLDPSSGNNTLGVAAYYDSIYFTRSNDNFGSWINNPFQFNLDTGAAYNTTGTWGTMSDRRLKTNVVNIDGSDALTFIMQLQGVNFDWINPEEHGNLLHSAGFIAQDVETVFPQWITEIDASTNDAELVDDGVVKTLSLPHQFNALVVESIKEQQNLITTNTNNINLNATATSVSELQTLTEQEFTDTNEILNQVQDDMVQAQSNILTIQENANILATQTIVEIENDIVSLQDSLSILTSIDTRVLSLNVDKLMFVDNGILTQSILDENGDEIIENVTELTLEGLLNVDKIIADEIQVKAVVIEDDVLDVDANGADVNAAMIGTGTIKTGETEIFIDTIAVEATSRVFVTTKTITDKNVSVNEISEGVGFVASVSDASAEDITFDWFIIGSK